MAEWSGLTSSLIVRTCSFDYINIWLTTSALVILVLNAVLFPYCNVNVFFAYQIAHIFSDKTKATQLTDWSGLTIVLIVRTCSFDYVRLWLNFIFENCMWIGIINFTIGLRNLSILEEMSWKKETLVRMVIKLPTCGTLLNNATSAGFCRTRNALSTIKKNIKNLFCFAKGSLLLGFLHIPWIK